jgi:nucleoside-diphosphate-sugar epimerase
MKIFVIGVNGFIGNALARRVVQETDWSVAGVDVEKDRLHPELLRSDRFEFLHGDITISREWVEFQIKRCDVVIPLAAVAIPKVYLENPLMVFELDFLENLRVVEIAAKYGKRLVFPSSSEVYGMATDPVFDEETTNFVLGPINKHRWIYSCAKQLLDRVIHAYGRQRGLAYTIFRPFNWVGPGLDRMEELKIGNSRVATQFIADIIFNRPIRLVDGGAQRRSLLYVDDGIDALLRILRNEGGRAGGQIFNLGNPDNEVSMRQLAELLVELYGGSPRARTRPFTAGIQACPSEVYYGEGYQDVTYRRPSIDKAKRLLGWTPRHGLRQTLEMTLASALAQRQSVERAGAPAARVRGPRGRRRAPAGATAA